MVQNPVRLGIVLVVCVSAREAFSQSINLPQRAAAAAAASGQPLPAAILPALTSNALREAADIDPAHYGGSTFTGDPRQRAVINDQQFGALKPRCGDAMIALSTGVVGAGVERQGAVEPGTDLGVSGACGPFPGGFDCVTATVSLFVPSGTTLVAFDWRMLSAEYPDFLVPTFGDAFFVTASVQGVPQFVALTPTNTVARANQIQLLPAVDFNAKKTGYDVACGDPSEVDFVFPGGVPDAGVSDWSTAVVKVTGGASVDLTFHLYDAGDAILDTTVLVDCIRFLSIEVVDAADPQFQQGPRAITQDAERLKDGGKPRIGATADGESRLLLRAAVAGPGQVAFAIQGLEPVPQNGSLHDPGPNGPPAQATTTVPAVLTTSGWYAFAIYRAPPNYVRPAANDAAAPFRNVIVNVVFTPAAGPPVGATVKIVLLRPPVVLAHGLWSNAAAWNGFGLNTPTALWDVYRLDYSTTHASPFRTNAPKLGRALAFAVGRRRARGYACAQADVVCHSMGGVVTRTWVRFGLSRRASNFDAGDVHKFLTICTPHWGSPLANLLIALGSVPAPIFSPLYLRPPGLLFQDVMNAIGMPIHLGGVSDLREGSAALAAMGGLELPTHTITGKGGSETLGNVVLFAAAGPILTALGSPLGPLFTAVGVASFGAQLAIFRHVPFISPNPHDLIVIEHSQRGRPLPPTAATTSFSNLGVFDISATHTEMPSNAAVKNLVRSLLHAQTGGASFAGLPLAVLNPAGAGYLQENESPSPEPSGIPLVPPPPGAGMSITSAAPTSPVAPGAALLVTATPTDGFAPTEVVFFLGASGAVVASAPPFQALLIVPPGHRGPLSILAVGFDAATEHVAASLPQTFDVRSGASLTGLSTDEESVTLEFPGETFAAQATGSFSDGVPCALSFAASGTTWLTSDAAVATVSADGLVTATGEGVCAIVAQNGGLQASFVVEVAYEPLAPYGVGLPGAGGIAPVKGTLGGSPQLGNAAFQLHMTQAVGGAPGVALASFDLDLLTLPGGGVVLIDLSAVFRTEFVVADRVAGAPGAGAATVASPIPAAPPSRAFRPTFKRPSSMRLPPSASA